MDSVDDKTLIRKTLLMVAAMVGACVFVVGSISLVALLVVGRATKPQADDTQVNAPQLNAPTQDPRAPQPNVKPPQKPSQI